MSGKESITSALAAVLLIAPMFKSSQDAVQKRTLIVNGQSTQVPVVQVKGHPYVGLEEFTNAINGSLSYSGDTIALSVPIGQANSNPPASNTAPTTTSTQSPSQNSGFSSGFLRAGIEQMSSMREWHAALATAIQNGFPLSAQMLAPYRAEANTNLHLALVAATTPSDHSAYQLLNNEFENMAKLSDKYVKTRANMSYIAPDSLQNDNLNQRVIACGHSLGAMAASGQFVDNGSCN